MAVLESPRSCLPLLLCSHKRLLIATYSTSSTFSPFPYQQSPYPLALSPTSCILDLKRSTGAGYKSRTAVRPAGRSRRASGRTNERLLCRLRLRLRRHRLSSTIASCHGRDENGRRKDDEWPRLSLPNDSGETGPSPVMALTS